MRIQTYHDPPALLRGLSELRKGGLTPRGLLFLALDSHGAVHLALPGDLSTSSLRVGEKLTLSWPGTAETRLYHFDSIHVLRDDFYVFNGDRRLSHPGDAMEVGIVMATFLKWSRCPNVFFGCTPHQPGTWLHGGKEEVSLHDYGMVEIVPVPSGLLARRIHDHRLYLLTFADIARTGHLEDWLPVFASPLGNILLLERRVRNNLLVLNCERGMVEVFLGELPRVREQTRLEMSEAGAGREMTYAVVGRIEGEAFAVTRGTPRPWGLENLQPAEMVFTRAGCLSEMKALIIEAERLVAREI